MTAVGVVIALGLTLGLIGQRIGPWHYAVLVIATAVVTIYELLGGSS